MIVKETLKETLLAEVDNVKKGLPLLYDTEGLNELLMSSVEKKLMSLEWPLK
jgi:hypothetical protein